MVGSFQPPQGNSWLGSIIATIIGNLKVSISNVHIRYEDSTRFVAVCLFVSVFPSDFVAVSSYCARFYCLCCWCLLETTQKYLLVFFLFQQYLL